MCWGRPQKGDNHLSGFCLPLTLTGQQDSGRQLSIHGSEAPTTGPALEQLAACAHRSSCKWGLLGLGIKGQLIPHPWMRHSGQHYCPISRGKEPSSEECQGCCVSPGDLRSALGTRVLWPVVLKRGITCIPPHPHQPRALAAASPQTGQLQPDNFNGQDPPMLRSYQVLILDII